MKHENCIFYRRADRQIADDGAIGHSLVRLDTFPMGKRPCGVSFQPFYSLDGNRCLPRHARVSVLLNDVTEWLPVWEMADIPETENFCAAWAPPAVPVRACKMEILEVYHGGAGHRDLTSRAETVLFSAGDSFLWEFAEDGTPLSGEAPWFPQLTTSRIADGVVSGVMRRMEGSRVEFRNGWMRAIFSLLRPTMLEFAWDSERSGREESNLVVTHSRNAAEAKTGPFWQGAHGVTTADFAGGGTVAVESQGLRYGGVKIGDHASADYHFTFSEDALEIDFLLKVEKEELLWAGEVWRWVWNLRESIVATLPTPLPLDRAGAMGRAQFPLLLHAPHYGTLAMELIDGEWIFCRVDTQRKAERSWLGIECGVVPQSSGECRTVVGEHRFRVRLRPIVLAPAPVRAEHRAFRRTWANVFGFRPEYYGMSNNAASLNCHFVQHTYADMVFFLPSESGVSVRRLCCDSVELALRGGLGYGHHREYFLDSDASLLIAAGTLMAAEPNPVWLEKMRPFLLRAIRRLQQHRDPADGLIVCPHGSGNSGERHWSSNWWDVIAFGHKDAFVNAFAYRAFSLSAKMLEQLGEEGEALRCRKSAQAIQASYFPCFFNPETGWLGGWRSRDGQLHDYAFLFINGMGVVYDLIPAEQQRAVLERLEAKREEVGFHHFQYGLPGNLLPIRREDYTAVCTDSLPYLRKGLPVPLGLGEPQRADGWDSFGFYENGGATMSQAYFYIRALGKVGVPSVRGMEDAILDSFDCGICFGEIFSGKDWAQWDGRSNGYEGLLSDQFYVLLAIAQNRGLLTDCPM